MATGTDLLRLDEAPGVGPVPDDFQVFGKLPSLPGKEFRVPASRLRSPGGAGGPTADYISTETLGGISAGDSFTTDDATLVKLLVKYQAPSFQFFNLGGQGSQTVEVGTAFPAGFKSFTWGTNNAQTVAPNSFTLRDVTTSTDLATGEANDGVLSASTVAYVAVLGEFHRYRLTGLNDKGGSFSADLVHAGAYLLYYGPAGQAPTDRASALALGSIQLVGGGGSAILNTGTSALKMVILLPPGRTLQSVTDLTNQQLDLTPKYVAQPTISVNDAGGNPVPGYTPYVLSIATPYTVSARHQFTYA